MSTVMTRFEMGKVVLLLKRSGADYIFKRAALNEFGEKTNPPLYTDVLTIRGMYHEQNSNIQITATEGTQIRTKKIPMILCLYDDLSQSVMVGDIVNINGKVFKVTGIVNIQEWNIITDISLEVIDNGLNP